jgi:ribulose bisphosphate carboxylase small subunit
MFTSGKPSAGFFSSVRRLARRMEFWWMSLNDQQQRVFKMRAAAVVSCGLGVVVTFPAVSLGYSDKIASAEVRQRAERMAEGTRLNDGVDATEVSALLDHPWMMSVEYALERDPRNSLSRFSQRYRDAVALDNLTSFDLSHMDGAEDAATSLRCLSEAVYYEARSEDERGQIGVAEVVMNRVRDHRYPDTVCEVVYQGSERVTGCQFTFTCDGALAENPRGEAWDRAQLIATHVLLDLHRRVTGEATHYHTDYVDPIWRDSLIETRRLGTHIFYRFPRGAEWAMVRERQAKAVGDVLQEAGAASLPDAAVVQEASVINASLSAPDTAPAL